MSWHLSPAARFFLGVQERDDWCSPALDAGVQGGSLQRIVVTHCRLWLLRSCVYRTVEAWPCAMGIRGPSWPAGLQVGDKWQRPLPTQRSGDGKGTWLKMFCKLTLCGQVANARGSCMSVLRNCTVAAGGGTCASTARSLDMKGHAGGRVWCGRSELACLRTHPLG